MEELGELFREFGLDEECVRIWFDSFPPYTPEEASEDIRNSMRIKRFDGEWDSIFDDLKRIKCLKHDIRVIPGITSLLGKLSYEVEDSVTSFILQVVTQILHEITESQKHNLR